MNYILNYFHPTAIISIHDTDITYANNHIVTKDVSDQHHHEEFANGPSKFIEEIGPEFQRFDLFNNGILKEMVNGLTKMQKLNLVTVVGHNTTLLPHMLNYYKNIVDEIYVVVYRQHEDDGILDEVLNLGIK